MTYLPRPAVLAVAAVLSVTSLSACGSESTSSSDAEADQTIAAAFYPLAWATEQVAGDAWTVENLTTPGGEPHDLELSINQTVLVSDSALVVHESGFQPAVDTAVEENASGAVLDAAAVVDLQEVDADEHAGEYHAEGSAEEDHEGHDHAEGEHDHAEEDHVDEDHAEEESTEEAAEEDHEGHDHGDLDPHFWIDPVRMATLGDALAEKLTELDPDNAAEYEQNAADLRSELEALDTEYAEGLANCERDDVVVGHDAFGYLSKYDLEVHSILGLSPEAEPSASTLSKLGELIDENGVTTVFTETLASPKAAESLANEAGVETAVLDPVEGLTEETEDEDYMSLMQANLAALQEANNC